MLPPFCLVSLPSSPGSDLDAFLGEDSVQDSHWATGFYVANSASWRWRSDTWARTLWRVHQLPEHIAQRRCRRRGMQPSVAERHVERILLVQSTYPVAYVAGIQHRRPGAWAGCQDWSFLACCVLPMGWSNSVGIMQDLAEKILLRGGLPVDSPCVRKNFLATAGIHV